MISKDLLDSISHFNKGNKPDQSSVDELRRKIDFKIDSKYMDLLEEFDGLEGELKSGNFILFWKISEVIELNPYYEDLEACDNLFFFGSDGSNSGYAFEKKNTNIVLIDFSEIGSKKPIVIASSITQLFTH